MKIEKTTGNIVIAMSESKIEGVCDLCSLAMVGKEDKRVAFNEEQWNRIKIDVDRMFKVGKMF